jgi:hypothetical protein
MDSQWIGPTMADAAFVRPMPTHHSNPPKVCILNSSGLIKIADTEIIDVPEGRRTPRWLAAIASKSTPSRKAIRRARPRRRCAKPCATWPDTVRGGFAAAYAAAMRGLWAVIRRAFAGNWFVVRLVPPGFAFGTYAWWSHLPMSPPPSATQNWCAAVVAFVGVATALLGWSIWTDRKHARPTVPEDDLRDESDPS